MVSIPDNPVKILESNKRFQSKLSWKRAQSNDLRNQIHEFISDNFNVNLPTIKETFESLRNNNHNASEELTTLYEDYAELVNLYYTLGRYGLSIGSLFEKNGEFETFTQAHMYSRHKMDPVWLMRKSQLIRNIYRNYLQSSETLKKTHHPVHITLTLPHGNGVFRGQRFYATELIYQFNILRKYPAWKSFVYAGEYGVEVKKTVNTANGLHIHIHSFSLLNENASVNKFRKWLQTSWLKLTGGSHIWVETLYFFKKDDHGKYLSKKSIIDGKPQEQRIKFYLNNEIRHIKKSLLTETQKQQTIQEIYLKGIMECIKYHFKMDDLMQIGSDKLFDIELINDILTNTKGKRMYSRYGAFYNEPALNFNNLEAKGAPDEINSESTDRVVNPFTIEFAQTTETNKVCFYPEKQKRQPKTGAKPYSLINKHDPSIYKQLTKGVFAKEAVKEAVKINRISFIPIKKERYA